MNGITAIIGVIITLVKRKDVVETIWYGHFENLIVFFFVTLAIFLAGLLSWPLALSALLANDFAWPFPALASLSLLFGLLIIPIFAIWYLYRIIRGLLRAINERAY